MELLAQGSTNYYRLDVKRGLGKIQLDGWKGKDGQKTMDVIRAKSAEYLENVRQQISDVARDLIEIGRARSSRPYRDRWARFCNGVEYEYRVPACFRGRDRFQERQQLHIYSNVEHPGEHDPSQIEDLIDSGRCFPRYEVAPRDEERA